MKLRDIKRRSIQSSLHNVIFFVRLDIKVKREISESDLIDHVPVYETSTDISVQYDRFLEGIWFPMIDQYPSLLDSCGYDESSPLINTTITFDIQMNSGYDREVSDEVNKFVKQLNEKYPDLLEIENITLYGYNSITGEQFVVGS